MPMPRRMQRALALPLMAAAAAMAAALALAAAKLAEAQSIEGAPGSGPDRSEVYFTQCLLDWDVSTHMTKQEWSRACRRLSAVISQANPQNRGRSSSPGSGNIVRTTTTGKAKNDEVHDRGDCSNRPGASRVRAKPVASATRATAEGDDCRARDQDD
jgi:hypothetical protein